MDYLRNWLRELIIVFFIASVLDLFLPEGNIKKYLRIVLSFFIILLILTPIQDIIKFNLRNYESIFNKNQFLLTEDLWDENIELKGENVYLSNINLLKNYYKSEIEKNIISVLNSYNIKNFNKISINTDNELKIIKITIFFNHNKNDLNSKIYSLKNKIAQKLKITNEKIEFSFREE
ncbi:MAG: stage III sporulation protein AF [Bacillota bacterium]